MKRKLLTGLLAGAVAALVGIQGTSVAAQAAQSWTVMEHFAYADGTSYDYVLRSGATTDEMRSILQECGRSHRTGSVVRYYCYPVAE